MPASRLPSTCVFSLIKIMIGGRGRGRLPDRGMARLGAGRLDGYRFSAPRLHWHPNIIPIPCSNDPLHALSLKAMDSPPCFYNYLMP